MQPEPTATKQEDIFITAYRDHALAIAKGVTPKSCMAELFGKATGCSGKGGSMHFFGVKERFFGGHGIVGAQIGTVQDGFCRAVSRYRQCGLTFFGDGSQAGILHETFNLAMLKLPVVFICENNNYAMGTSSPGVQCFDIYKLQTLDMPGDSVDGMSPEGVRSRDPRMKRARERRLRS